MRFHSLAADASRCGALTHSLIHCKRFEQMSLCEGAARMRDSPNAGGTSLKSECLSLELLHRLFGAQLRKTEMELQYTSGSKITDYSVWLNGRTLGVSVTRAMKFLGRFTAADADALLRKKLFGVNMSTQNCANETFSKQILHVFAEAEYVAQIMCSAFDKLARTDAELTSNTLMLVTVAPQRWVYHEYE